MTGAVSRLRGAWRGVTGSGSTATASLGVLVFCCVFLAMAGPRAGLGYRTQALQEELKASPLLAKSVVGRVDYTGYLAGMGRPPDSRDLAATGAVLSSHLTNNQVPVQTNGWANLTTAFVTVSGLAPRVTAGGLQPAQMELSYRPNLSDRAGLVAGRYAGHAHRTGHRTVFEVDVTEATASLFGLRPGSRISAGPRVTLLVTGVIRPRQEHSGFWITDPVVTAPIKQKPTRTPAYWTGGAFIGPTELRLLPRSFDPAGIKLSWVFPLDLGQMDADAAGNVRAALIGAASREQLAVDGHGNRHFPVDLAAITLSSGLSSTLAVFVEQDRAAGRVLDLLSVSLAVIAAAVVALGAQLVAERRSRDFEVLRSRGASRRQVALVALDAAVTATLPAAVAGGALGIALTPGDAARLAWVLAGVIAGVAVVSVPIVVVRQHTRAGTGRPVATRRMAAEVALVAAAVGGLLALHQQGSSSTSAGIYPSMAPVLVAVPAAIAVMRCYPLVVRALLRATRLRRGVAGFVGFARAAMAPAVAALPVFALVLALSVVAFGAMVRTSIRQGEVAASWQRVGADAVVNAAESARRPTPAVQHAVAAVPGVEHLADVAVLAGSAHGTSLTVAAVRPAQYAALAAATPAGADAAVALARRARGVGSSDGHVPVLASPAAAALLTRTNGGLTIGTRLTRVRVVDTVDGVAGVTDDAVVVFPEQALGSNPSPSLLLAVGSDLRSGRLAAVAHRLLPGASVTLRSRALDRLASAPLPRSASLAVVAGTAAASGLSALIIFIALVLGSRTRGLTLTRLRVLGLTRRQANWLVAVEVMPQILAAAAGGVACAWAMAPLVGPSLDLSVFAGTGTGVVQTRPGWLAAAAAGLLVLAALMLTAQTLLTNRGGSAARALRENE